MIGEDPLDLGGQVALVTGAGQSVGREIALMLARHNAGGVAVNDFVPERAAAVAAEIEAMGVPAIPVVFDVGDLAAVRAGVATATEKLGPVTLLVNNAGNAGPNAQIGLSPEFWETDPSEWDRYFRTNTFGVMNCCHATIPGMIQAGGGRIVTIVSDAGRVGEARLAAYSAAKAAAGGFVRAIAKEAGRYGITSNAIALSAILPPMEDKAKEQAFLESDGAKRQVSRYVIRRFGRPDDVAGAALFLCSDAAGFITGQTYPVNGGYSFAV
ncbi:SDR family NAD(P)-dependent oxidoreductase [Phenylobacterium sp. LjRoot225]|uniref:SDR family NAD(P)-dependent oxidoreductase n=1 Tax=Phenylobacterium sp. LjRoot225 TaxID=3342285 RepID=UPI003ECC81D3